MAVAKTVFIGSIFSFKEEGVDEFIRDFNDGYQDKADEAPFMSYDQEKHMFKIENLEMLDEKTPRAVLDQISSYTQVQASENDLLTTKIQAQHGFHTRMATEYGNLRSADLIELELDDPETTCADAFAALKHCSTEWRPDCGNVDILPRGVAESLSTLTGTSIHPERHQNLVRLVNGDYESTLEKLKILEPLLKFQYQERRNANVLITTDTAIKPVMGIEKLRTFDSPAFRRIIVPPRLEAQLPTRFVCEARIVENGNKVAHPNLLQISETQSMTKSLIWQYYGFKKVGTPDNTKERAAASIGRPGVASIAARPTGQHYLEPSKAAEVQGWSMDITSGDDPNQIAPEVPEEEPAAGRRRRVAVDSDSDDEEESLTMPIATKSNDFSSGGDRRYGVPETTSTAHNFEAPTPEALNGNYPSNLTDDGQFLEGLPYKETPRLISPAPSTLPSNLMSIDSESSPKKTNRNTSRLDDNSSVLSFVGGLRHEHLPAINDGMAPSQASVRNHDGKMFRLRGGRSVGRANSPINTNRPPPGLGYSTPSELTELASQSDAQWSSLLGRDDSDSIDPSVVEKFAAQETAPVNQSSKHWVNGRKPDIDSDARRDEIIASMKQGKSLRGSSQSTYNEWSTVSRRGKGQKKSRGGMQQPKAVEEQPRYRKTMAQQAPNPGRGGSTKPMTAAARQAKMKEIFGGSHTAHQRSTSTSGPGYSDMTSGKKKLLDTNQEMAQTNGIDTRQESYRDVEAARLKAQLEPLFEHSRAFSGKLDFAISFGAVLLATNPHVRQDKSFNIKKWNLAFGADVGPDYPLTFFTSILTSNGADMDRFLKSRAKLNRKASRIFDDTHPGPSSVTFEFHCETKNGENFLVDVREDLSYDIRNSTDSLGMVCLQCPAQIWDASAMLQGAEYWRNAPPEVEETIKSFVDDIYIPSGPILNLFFRQPAGNVVTVKNLLMKRVSPHSCLRPGHEDFLLRITEHTTLSIWNAPNEKRLCVANEPDQVLLDHEPVLHYEMAIVDQSINKAFEANQNLEMGDAMLPDVSGKSLLNACRIQQMLEIAVLVLTKIDFVGAQNKGTMVRLHKKQAARNQSLPPGLRSQLHIAGSVLPSDRYDTATSIVSGSCGGTEIPPRGVHGVRMNAKAGILRDEQGNYYRKGLGGARVPMAMAPPDGLETVDENVLPEDSASQLGGPARPSRGAQIRDTATQWTPEDGMEPGFW